MTELSLFSGAGGGLLATKHLLGWKTVGYVENNKYCQKVLRQRIKDGYLDDAPIFHDVRTFDGLPYRGKVDCITAGFPCQPFSGAARGRQRSEKNLWPEALRVIKEVSPQYIFLENVSKRAINVAGDDCEALGYRTKAISLSAADLGGDHLRQRYWLLAHTNHEGELSLHLDAKVEKLPSICPSVWNTYPSKSRVADGVANRVDRIRAIGNGQVPIVAATAWRDLTNEI